MIYIVFAAPRQGKTYFCTYIALQALKKAKKENRKVYSNYPIYHKKYGSTFRWEAGMEQDNITDSTIIIDEAYQAYNSRNFKGFSKDEHLFFSLNGHNGNDIWLIAHSPQRVDVVIREMVDMFYFVTKYSIPFTERPIFFKIEGYQDELALAKRFSADAPVYSAEYHWFSRGVANAYDTHQFRVTEENIKDPIPWMSSKLEELPQPKKIELSENSISEDTDISTVQRKNERFLSNYARRFLIQWVTLWMKVIGTR